MPKIGPKLWKLPVAKVFVTAEVLLLARRHLLKLEPHERRRVIELLRLGHGRPGHLSTRERRELSRLVEKAEPREFVKSAMKKVAGIPVRGSGKSPDPS